MTFRLNAKNLYLTYPKCSLPKEEVLAQLEDLCPEISEYMVAEEKHQDGESHIHAFLSLKEKINITCPNTLDLTGVMGEKYHGNYQGTRSRNKVLRYCMKDGNYTTNILMLPSNSTASKHWTEAISKTKEGNTEEAMKIISEHAPRDFVLQHDKVLAFFNKYRVQQIRSFLTWDHFKQVPIWDKQKTLIIWGTTGIGKTSLAKLLLPEALFATHLDTLKMYNINHNGVILDDMSFLHLPRESQIHIVDTYDERQIHCRHSNAVLPAGTPRIVTTNLWPQKIFNTNDEAILRRITTWEVRYNKDKTLRKIVNIDKLY